MNTRTLLLLLPAFLGFMLYVEWQSDFANPVPPQVEELPGENRAATERAEEEADLPELPDAGPETQPRSTTETDASVPSAALARSISFP